MTRDDFTVFYYTYSTIAQTLAGLMGFMVAIVLFRMQTLEARIAQLWDAAHRPTETEENKKSLGYLYIHRNHELNKLKGRLTPAVVMTAFTIAACFILMPLSNVDSMPSKLAAWVCCIATIGMSLVTLGLYVPVVREITTHPIATGGGMIHPETGEVLEGKALSEYVKKMQPGQSNPPAG